jgi:23S rRNA (uracil1939-C5)-methyltransferase
VNKSPAAAELTLSVEKVIHGGAGLSRHEGRVVMTPFVLPGEQIRVAVAREKKDLIEATLLEVLSPSEHRTTPDCRIYSKCGGCQLQHATYEEQLAIKLANLREVLQRIGKLTPPEEIKTVSAQPFAYRNRIQLHLDGHRVGYRAPGAHRVIDAPTCPVASPKLNESIHALRKMVRSHRFPRFVRSIELFTNERDVQINIIETMAGQRVARQFFDWCEAEIPGAATGPIDYAAAGRTFRVHYKSFFQVNRFLIEPLVTAAINNATGPHALELYAGVGLFSLALKQNFEKVTAVESVKSAVEDLEENARRAKLSIDHQRADVTLYLETLDHAPDFVLADPPRAGLGPAVVRQLARLQPAHIAIVSCDPATLARDLQALTAAGYAIETMTLFDLFPQTSHMETVTHLRRA